MKHFVKCNYCCNPMWNDSVSCYDACPHKTRQVYFFNIRKTVCSGSHLFNSYIDGTTLSIFSDQYDRLLTLTISDESGNPIISEILSLSTGEDSTEIPTVPGNYTMNHHY